MILKSLVVIVGFTLVFCAVLYVRSQKPSRNAMAVVDRYEISDEVIGDGAWAITASEFPSSGVLRKEPEPRGM